MIYLMFAVIAVFAWRLSLKRAALQDAQQPMDDWREFTEAGERMQQ